MSRIKHVPLVVLEGSEFYFWDSAAYYLMFKASKRDGVFYIETFGSKLVLDSDHFSLLGGERKMWEKCYCPIPLDGKTVLDAGAGCGETAAFYLTKGAARVIAVESNPESFRLLQRNAEANQWKNVLAFNERFNPSFIDQYQPDFCKIDIEGGEECLLGRASLTVPSLVEVHSARLEEAFREKFGMKVVDRPFKDVSLMSNVS